ncbi:sulfotransferase [Mesorhizobium sp. M0293]|uniref:sulfotransferase family protein n=1 Tax=Mesorhizobium sp. M0293 TaxID=2956930 RepID=UPI003334C21B
MNKHPSPENTRDATPVDQAAPKVRKAKPKAAKRTCIMVLGMHRSGTSALTRAISLLGAELPKNMLGANPTNPAGHWEPLPLVGLHDRMLAEAGSRWDDWRSFDPADLGAARLRFYKAEIARLIDEEYGNSPLFVLKEPRISRFVPLYADILKRKGIDACYVLIGRNPLAVIASLEKRDKFTCGFSALLWLRHELEAERATRGRPRVFVSYEAMLDDWRANIEKIARTLRIGWPQPTVEAISTHFSTDLQHHFASTDLLDADLRVTDWVKQAYGALKALEKNPADAIAMDELDTIRIAFDRASLVFGEAVFPEMDVRGKAAAEQLAQQRHATDERAVELENARLEAAAREAHLTQKLGDALRLADVRGEDISRLTYQQEALRHLAEEQAADQHRRGVEASTREADLKAQIGREARRADGAESQVERLAEELEALKASILEIKSSYSWKVAYPARRLKALLKKLARRTENV